MGAEDLFKGLILEFVQMLERTMHDMVRGNLKDSFLSLKSSTREKSKNSQHDMALSAQCGLHHKH